jgi:hypothetical protein
MAEYTEFYFPSSGEHQVSIGVTPTPVPDYPSVPVEIPTGWVMAGFLALLLLMMLYQNFKRLIVGLFRKKKTR